jgi:hypothetical protein
MSYFVQELRGDQLVTVEISEAEFKALVEAHAASVEASIGPKEPLPF